MPQSATQVRPTGHPGYSETLPRVAESAAIARRLTTAALSCWGLEELAEDSALVMTELVANAVRHARGRSIRVLVERTGLRTVRVAVADFSQVRPAERAAGDDDEDGRGLFLVAALAADWGTDKRRWGKIVWAVLEGRA
ncbi:Histidine kinase-like ATPase domain-containing protein [Streptomyces sp. LamerLS-316]|uniref:ATP-binding protein n=1 Tax=unclassified Streptomyces TaxID=2593676 RepID=UPI0008237B12|nr:MULTISPECIES: ATP-binding protein [unclassified Streptomyces]MYQ41708.1 ATP-binding protein [Streptomyces sp. SID4921]SCK27771.1 Histidine kinase-like ATPase domain-containing protein [Streptomyces sp. LamerLS-316]